jgi:excisionase family DNA binding protein
MLSIEIRLAMEGKKVSVDSFVEAIARQVCVSVREEIGRTLTKNGKHESDSPREFESEMPLKAVSIREAARLLSISPRTIHNYIASNAIRTVRVGRRVLVPMESVNEVATKGIPRKRR